MISDKARPPIIGIAGGIGSGKSYVAQAFAQQGCVVFDADRVAKSQFADEAVKRQLRDWWGGQVFDENGAVDRTAVGRIVFENEIERKKLEGLIHPRVAAEREKLLRQIAADPGQIRAVVLDVPLLFEVGLHEKCDAVVFVETPFSVRLERVQGRGWDESELRRRENSQLPLDKKRELAQYVIRNGSQEVSLPLQVRDVLDRLAGSPPDDC